MNVIIRQESPENAACRLLFHQLWQELVALYPKDDIPEFVPNDFRAPSAAVVIARMEEEPVGCGAIRAMQPGVAEVKHVFVLPHARRMGLARRIMACLEETARTLGYTGLKLETGNLQPEAIGLYKSMGFRECACYGEYVDNPLSVCFEKPL